MNYTITVLGTKYQISKSSFLVAASLQIILGLAAVWCTYGGIWRFGENYLNSGWTTVIAITIISASFVFNGTRYALLPENVFTTWLNRIVWVSATIYYFYTMM